MDDIANIVIFIIEVLNAVVSGFGNAVIVYLIAHHRKLHNSTNYLIASLAMADCLVGVIGMPFVIVNRYGWPRNFYGCLFTSCIIIFLTQISIFSLTAIAVERFTAIKFPIFHRQHNDGWKTAMGVIVVWVSGVLVGIVPMFGWHLPIPQNMSSFECRFTLVIDMQYMVYFNFFTFVLVPLIAMFAAYGYIYSVVRSRSRRGHIAADGELSKKKLRREYRVAKRLFFILVIFAVCWIPLHITNSVTYFAEQTNIPWLEFAVILSFVNSSINPFLYAYTNKAIWQAFRITFHCSQKPPKIVQKGRVYDLAKQPSDTIDSTSGYEKDDSTSR